VYVFFYGSNQICLDVNMCAFRLFFQKIVCDAVFWNVSFFLIIWKLLNVTWLLSITNDSISCYMFQHWANICGVNVVNEWVFIMKFSIYFVHTNNLTHLLFILYCFTYIVGTYGVEVFPNFRLICYNDPVSCWKNTLHALRYFAV
jgi:hypothetical protein